MDTISEARLDGAALEAWRSYLQSHASIVRVLDAELVAEHAMTTRDYEVLLYLAQADGRRLAMSALAERTMLTRSGITRLVDGLVDAGLIERVACPNDARVSYAALTDPGLRQAAPRGLHPRRQHPAPVPRALQPRGDRAAGLPAEPPARRARRRVHRRLTRPQPARRRVCPQPARRPSGRDRLDAALPLPP